MRRVAVLAPLALLIALAGFITVWFSERRKREVLPASQAQLLLNPLRGLVMPVGKTLDRFGLSEGQTILELGPGPGYYSIEAAARVGQRGRLVCLDLQRGMLERLRERLPRGAGENVELVVGDATRLPLRAGVIDGAFLVTVLGEVPDPDAALAELTRVLKPAARVGFSESLGDPDIVFSGELRRLCRAAGWREAGFWRNPLGYTMTFLTPVAA
jgi:ubiquinone/menaquinone biosynthesis C-methylase UbiE